MVRIIAFATDVSEAGLCKDPNSGDAILAAALSDKGLTVDPVPWDKEDIDWKKYDAVIIRSTFNYIHKLDEFKKWCSFITQLGVPLFNNQSMVQWNCDKHYLLELQDHGLDIIPTEFVHSNDNQQLTDIMRKHKWSAIIVKPCVSASSYKTQVLSSVDEAEQFQDQFHTWLAERDMMVQKYIPEVKSCGEWSLMYFDKKFSHAVLKTQNSAQDLNPESDHIAVSAIPSEQVLSLANQVMDYIGSRDVLYARVDIVEHEHKAILMEVELIECYLYFGHDTSAVDRMVTGIYNRISDLSA